MTTLPNPRFIPGWTDGGELATHLPFGGAKRQALVKTSNIDFAVGWAGLGAFNFDWLNPPRNGVDDDAPFLNTMWQTERGCVITPGILNIKTPLFAPLANTKIHCLGGNQAVEWRRDLACTGNTLTVGSPNGSADPAGAFVLIDAFFTHSQRTSPSVTSLPNKLTSDESHIAVYYGSGARLTGTGGYGCPHFMSFFGGYNVLVDHPFIYGGVWDGATVGLQEGISHIRLTNHPTFGHSALFTLRGGALSGAGASAARPVTVGTKTNNIAQSIGPQFGLLVLSCEDWTVEGGFSGGYWDSNIHVLATNTSSNLNGQIKGARIDQSNHGGVFLVNTVGDNYKQHGLDIIGCDFNGQLCGQHAIIVQDGGFFAVDRLNISECRSAAHLSAAVLLEAADGGNVRNGRWMGYNTFGNDTTVGGSLVDVSGVLVSARSRNLRIEGNTYGGGINSDTEPNECQYGFADATTGQGNKYFKERALNLGRAGGAAVVGGTNDTAG